MKIAMKKGLRYFLIAMALFTGVVIFSVFYVFSLIECGQGYSHFLTSPSGKKGVIAKWRDCGATTKTTYDYYLVPSFSNDFFKLDLNGISKKTIFIKSHNENLEFEWINDDEVYVITNSKGQLKLLRNKVKGVEISVRSKTD